MYSSLSRPDILSILSNSRFCKYISVIPNKLSIPSVNYFSDDIRSKTSGPEWEKYLKYLDEDENYVFYWDKVLTSYENFKNIHYLPHFVNFDIYNDFNEKPEFDIMFAGRLDTDYRLSFFEELNSKLPDLKVAWYAIEKHFEDIRKFAHVIEDRGEDEDCTKEWILEINRECLEGCQKHDCEYKLIRNRYDVDEELFE